MLWESQIGESGLRPQLGRAPERAPADARQSLNRRRAKSPHTAPAERPRRCSTTCHTFNLSTVIGESAAIATQGRSCGLRTGYLHEATAPCEGLLVQCPCLCSLLRCGPPPGFAFPVALHPYIRPVCAYQFSRAASGIMVSLYRMAWLVGAMLLSRHHPSSIFSC